MNAAPGRMRPWNLAGMLPYTLGLAFAPALLPQFIYITAAPRVGHVGTAIAGSIELPAMVALGFTVFCDQPSAKEIVACALVVAVVLLMPVSRQPKRRPPAA